MPAMALRPRLRQLATTESGVALAREGGRAFVSASLRPYLVAGLLDGVDDALATRTPAIVVAGDDRQARDLAADLRHWLAPPALRFYPSPGGAYQAALPPPPPPLRLRVAPRSPAAPRRPQSRRPRRAARERERRRASRRRKGAARRRRLGRRTIR